MIFKFDKKYKLQAKNTSGTYMNSVFNFLNKLTFHGGFSFPSRFPSWHFWQEKIEKNGRLWENV